MRLRDGNYECSYCGMVLEVRSGEVPQFVIVAAGGEPNVRVLFLHRREMHRCVVNDVGTDAMPGGGRPWL